MHINIYVSKHKHKHTQQDIHDRIVWATIVYYGKCWDDIHLHSILESLDRHGALKDGALYRPMFVAVEFVPSVSLRKRLRCPFRDLVCAFVLRSLPVHALCVVVYGYLVAC